MKLNRGQQLVTLVAAAALLAAGCSSKKASTAASSSAAPSTAAAGTSATAPAGSSSAAPASSAAAAGGGVIGVDYPRTDSDFWNAYIKYIPQFGTAQNITIKTSSSGNDITKLNANADTLVAEGAKALLLAPQDTAGINVELAKLAAAKIPVVTADTEPDATDAKNGGAAGKVYMIVRADNKAFGDHACHYIGDTLKGVGNVVMFEGGLDSVNGRDRTTGFADCMKANYANMKVFAEPTKWDPPTAIAQLNAVLAGNKVNAIYMEYSSALAATLQDLTTKGLIKPVGAAGHIVIVSNDGVKSEYTAIEAGQMDATISQPADLYAKYGLFYANAALAGKTFAAGATDHNSTIVTAADGNLEDQLPSTLVTIDGAYPGSAKATDPTLWGNQ